MEPLAIDGTYLFTPKIHGDDRGQFLEWFRADALAPKLGHRLGLAQANCSISSRGVLRGVHWADVPVGQAKYVTCVRGAILDVAVDLRVGSPTFGRCEAVRLDEERRQGFYLAEGLGHAFMALTDHATVIYLASEPYNPTHEHTLHPLDPALAIPWPDDIEPQLSPRDAEAPTLAEAEAAGRLPDYETCLKYYAELS